MTNCTGTQISFLPTGSIGGLQDVFPLSVGMPSNPDTIAATLAQTVQFLQIGGLVAENAGKLTYITGSSYRIEAGALAVNNQMLVWSNPVTRTGLSLASGTVHYVYAYPSGTNAAFEESTTAPVWDTTYQYFKKTGDVSRRCIGFLQTANVNVIRKFTNIVSGRNSEFYYTDGQDGTGAKRVVSGGTASGTWTSFSLATFVPSHASHVWAIGKLAFTASGDDGILGISPIDLGSANAGQQAPYTVRDRGSANGTSTFFGHSFLPIAESQLLYYRVQTVAGSPTVNIEIQGARIVR